MTKKISQLPAATSVDTDDEFVINQDGTTKKLTTANQWQFANVDIDGGSITGITDLAVADGGTGASDASGARTNLGLGTIATQNNNSVNIDGGTIDGTAVNATNLAYTGTLTGGTGVVNLGSGQVFKDADGNVGIGTSSPALALEVNGANLDAAGRIRMATSILTSGFDIGWLGGGAVPEAYLWNRQNGPMLFGTNNTERMRIDSSGNVGIGTTAPTSALQVQGVYTQDQVSVRAIGLQIATKHLRGSDVVLNSTLALFKLKRLTLVAGSSAFRTVASGEIQISLANFAGSVEGNQNTAAKLFFCVTTNVEGSAFSISSETISNITQQGSGYTFGLSLGAVVNGEADLLLTATGLDTDSSGTQAITATVFFNSTAASDRGMIIIPV